MTKFMNHIIDADIRGFFNNVDHDWIRKMLEEKIADKNLLKIIRKFLKAGIMEEGKLCPTEEGIPPG